MTPAYFVYPLSIKVFFALASLHLGLLLLKEIPMLRIADYLESQEEVKNVTSTGIPSLILTVFLVIAMLAIAGGLIYFFYSRQYGALPNEDDDKPFTE